ncbi:MAG: cob(I)yrinic acid a,c-diamide adenosyltransferase [Ferruginibacter sp.]
MSFKIYTKTGDLGKTSLIGGTKVLKSHIRIESYGTIDELNSYIGLVSDMITDTNSRSMLREIQDRLFTIGSSLACDPNKETKLHIPDLTKSDVELLEKEMDKMDEQLPEMKNFILPAGHPAVSTIHICRCVCRRAERICVHMLHDKEIIAPLVIKYLNRLSDYLFMLARYTSHLFKVPEVPWKPRL